MAYIIGTSINTSGTHEVINHETVREARFNKELETAIKSLYPNDTAADKKMIEILTKSAQDGLNKYRSVHIAGKYFFNSRRDTKETLRNIKN